MTDLFINLFGSLATELRKHKRLRKALVFVSPIAGIFFVFARLIGTQNDGFSSQGNRLADFVFTPLIFISFATFVVALASFTSFEFRAHERRLDVDLDALRREREELRTRLAQEDKQPHQGPADVLDTIRLNLNQLTEYYTINKGQARSSFRASIGAMIAGLATILAGIWIFYSRSDTDLKIPVISGVAGVLAEFISVAYFYLYNRSLSQLNYFFDKLTSMQDTMLAIKLCENLPEPNSTNAKEHLIMSLMTPNRIVAPEISFAAPIHHTVPKTAVPKATNPKATTPKKPSAKAKAPANETKPDATE